MTNSKPIILVAVIALLVGAIYFLSTPGVKKSGVTDAVTVSPSSSTTNASHAAEISEKSKKYEQAKEITTPDGFINTDGKPVTVSEFVGKKVMLVDFWTYSCINCQRTTPYLNAWYEKYKNQGLVIIGVHTPEFAFEKKYENVKAAVAKLGIKFPVVLDNDYSTWTAYKNQYWPHKYLIDIDGYIVYDHIGEGGYEETEQKIQNALRERATVLGESTAINQPLTKETPSSGGAQSPETYFGASRNQFLGNAPRSVLGDRKKLSFPKDMDLNQLYLSGDWTFADEFAQNNSSDAGVNYLYNAQNVFFVAGAESETVVEVLRDGNPLGAEAGADIEKTTDGKTIVKIKEERLYKIIQDAARGVHGLKLIIQKPGLKAFTFTFG